MFFPQTQPVFLVMDSTVPVVNRVVGRQFRTTLNSLKTLRCVSRSGLPISSFIQAPPNDRPWQGQL